MLAEIEQPGIGRHLTPGHPVHFGAMDRLQPAPAPALGAHTDEVLASVLRLDSPQIAGLHDRGIVRGPDRSYRAAFALAGGAADPPIMSPMERSTARSVSATNDIVLLADVVELCRAASAAVDRLAEQARFTLGQRLLAGGRIVPARLEADQFAAHGHAWLATYATALREMLDWAERLAATGRLGEVEQLMPQAAFGEYLRRWPAASRCRRRKSRGRRNIGIGDTDLERFHTREVDASIAGGNTAAVRGRLSGRSCRPAPRRSAASTTTPPRWSGDQFRKFAVEKIAEHAQTWHREDRLIST